MSSAPLATRIRRRKVCEASLIESEPLAARLRLTILNAQFRATQDCELPEYKGSTIRGALGHSLMAISGHVKDGECPLCARDRCAYRFLFEETRSSSGHRGTGVLPMILQPPLEKQQRYREGETIALRLVLIGDAVSWVPTVVWALGRMGFHGLGKGRAQWELCEVDATTGSGRPMSLLDSFDRVPVVTGQEIIAAWPDFDTCELQFQTPVCFRTQGDVMTHVDPQMLIRRLNGRTNDLLETFCGVAGNYFDSQTINEAAERITVVSSQFEPAHWERVSFRTGQRHGLQGITGSIKLANVPKVLTPLLILGQFLHVGKSAAFGMGNFQLTAG